MNHTPQIHTLDLNFLDLTNAIAAYLIPHEGGAVLIECGPSSTLATLQTKLAAHGYTSKDITDVLLTHIHLDHAGAAGWFAREGANIHVHHVGAPHLINPKKLLHSAGRIYGDVMDELWGEVLPVPEERIFSLHNNDEIEIGELVFRAIDTPGHAYHHMAYLFNEVCFSGDVGGVRLPIGSPRHLRIPAPPPEFHLDIWRQSIVRLREETFTRIAPTHFGIFDDPDWHLAALSKSLNEIETWMTFVMADDPPIKELRQQFSDWARRRSTERGVDTKWFDAFEAANPSWMSADGIHRYWHKHHNQT